MLDYEFINSVDGMREYKYIGLKFDSELKQLQCPINFEGICDIRVGLCWIDLCPEKSQLVLLDYMLGKTGNK